MYGLAEASKLTGVPSARIRRWLCGYTYRTAQGERSSSAVFEHQLPVIEGAVALSFLDLIEVKVVNSLRLRKISWKLIRLAEIHARDIFKVSHPFATKRFKTDGRSIFTWLRKSHGESALVDLAENQLAFRSVVEPHLKDIDFDRKHVAARWWPMGSHHNVLLDPRRSFGQPIVREGVPTAVLARAFSRESSHAVVARWYEVDLRAVKDAVEFERRLAA
jgi:uncharacterized protein (DUF433 family)